MRNTVEALKESLQTGFINYKVSSFEAYQPSLLINDSKREKRVLTTLIKELNECEGFYFSVAFITNSGIASIINTLKVLEARGIQGKIIASQYQNFTQPEALKRLKALTNIELRIVTENNFHAKSYIFKKQTEYTLIIGSSNLTQNALSYNKEWNLKVTSSENGDLLKYTLEEFNRTFEEAQVVDDKWLAAYEALYKAQFQAKKQVMYQVQDTRHIVPNKMQLKALEQLQALRDEGKDKALLISATGTGKTYFSAFDVERVKPKRFLFVVHRENITRAALKSYRRILGPTIKMGILSGTSKDYEADYLFATVQTLCKENILNEFAPDHFDYIVIDEVHRAGASSYERIFSHFKPKFLLGMSATPERMDGYDIYKTFDYNIAYEIRLNNALQEQMLCPFHYYGVSEIEVDGKPIDEKTNFNALVSEDRIQHVIEKAKLYGCDHGRVKGLVFCSRVEEAKGLSEAFNQRGFQTIALDGSSSEQQRETAIEQLENDGDGQKLDYIFTVDIFNEGVDIPSINQIIMLRPTKSSIVFIQQLGRGLRKTEDKEYVVVIDFIGNYANNFLVPIALYGDNSYNKDRLRRLMTSGSCSIPGVSTVNFDAITKERIYKAIDQTNMATKKALVEEYKNLKYKLGRMPMMTDFIAYGSRNPYAFVQYSGSYYHFVTSIGESVELGEEATDAALNPSQAAHLIFYSKEVGNAKRVEELIILQLLLNKSTSHNMGQAAYITIKDVQEVIHNQYGYSPSMETLISAISYLNCEFFVTKDQEKYQKPYTIEVIDKKEKDNILNMEISENVKLYLGESLKEDLQNTTFKAFLLDLIRYALGEFDGHYNNMAYDKGFIRYHKYSRKDVCRILNWKNDESSTMYGYRAKYNTFPIFVTYHKQDDISETTKYEDSFINKYQFSWMTRSNVTTDSKEVVILRDYEKTGLRISLFIKKSDEEGTEFYYMGDVEPLALMDTTIKNDKDEDKPIVNVTFSLKHPVEDNLYEYMTTNLQK